MNKWLLILFVASVFLGAAYGINEIGDSLLPQDEIWISSNVSGGGNGTTLSVLPFPIRSLVGRPTTFTLSVRDANNVPRRNVWFDFKAVQTEKYWTVVSTRIYVPDGIAKFSYVFGDGAMHLISVDAMPANPGEFSPLHGEYKIDIDPQSPNTAMKVRILVSLFLFFAVGALIGRWWTGRMKKSARVVKKG